MFFFFFILTGLATGQPNHTGPGDPDWALPASDCQTSRRGGVPVFPQRPRSALLPLQGPSGPIRDSSHQCLLPPESFYREHHEVWVTLKRFLFLTNKCGLPRHELLIPFLVQSVPWSSSPEQHAAGAQAAEELPDSTHKLHQQQCGQAKKSCPRQREPHPCTAEKWHLHTRERHSLCYVMANIALKPELDCCKLQCFVWDEQKSRLIKFWSKYKNNELNPFD